MDTHLHLLIETPEPNLGCGMQALHGDYAQQFNKRHGRRGHLFEQRYGSKPIGSDEQLKVVAAYIANNPVAAGMCARPEQYAWSSHRAVLLDRAPPWLAAERLLEFFSAGGGVPLERYRRFVAGNASGDAQPLRALDGLGAVADLELAIDRARVLLDRVR